MPQYSRIRLINVQIKLAYKDIMVRSLIIAGWPTLMASYAMLASGYDAKSNKWRASLLSHRLILAYSMLGC